MSPCFFASLTSIPIQFSFYSSAWQLLLILIRAVSGLWKTLLSVAIPLRGNSIIKAWNLARFSWISVSKVRSCESSRYWLSESMIDALFSWTGYENINLSISQSRRFSSGRFAMNYCNRLLSSRMNQAPLVSFSLTKTSVSSCIGCRQYSSGVCSTAIATQSSSCGVASGKKLDSCFRRSFKGICL